MEHENSGVQRLWHLSEAATLCCLVGSGKPAASVQVPVSLADEVEAECHRSGCLAYRDMGCVDAGWCVIYIYRSPVMLDVIKHSLSFHDETPVEIWFRGCMYGYSLAAIEEMSTREFSLGHGQSTSASGSASK